eukprot:gene9411-10221_t
MERKLNFGESNDSGDSPRNHYSHKFNGSEDEFDSSRAHRRSSSRDHKSTTYVAEEKTSSTTGSRFTSKKETPSSSSASAKFSTSFAEEKQKLIEIQQDIEADEEFEALKKAPKIVNPIVGQSALARRFVSGFRILSMNMRDATTGRLVWRSADWNVQEMFEKEIAEEIPKEILRCRIVSREIIFTSKEEMNNFRLEQRVYFKGVCIEEWFFTFGYVMSGSRNSWQQTIDAAPPNEMLPAEVLSGQVVFETSFFDDKEFLCKNSVRIYYV